MNIYVNDFIKKYNDTTIAINEAIKYVNNEGGGNVIFSSYTKYEAGLIILKSNVCLFFEDYALLKMTSNKEKLKLNDSKHNMLNKPCYEDCEYNGEPNEGFIRAVSCSNISICGKGIIDGNEEIFYGNENQYFLDGLYYPRVPLIYLKECNNVNIKNITLRRSAFWTIHLVGSENIDIDGIYIFNNLKMANCDGIDPDHCKNIKIRNSYIEAADDGIVFKTTRNNKKYGTMENVLVENCTIISTSAGIKIGTESVSDFKKFNISNVNILRSNRGISLQLRDEGNISDLKFESINMDLRMFEPNSYWGKAEPIAITAISRFKNTKHGKISNILFNNIKADTENGIFFYTDKNLDIFEIKLNNISLYLHKKSKWDTNIHDLRPGEGYGIIYKDLSVIDSNNTSYEINNFNYINDLDIKK